MGVIAICSVRASSLAEETANWVVLKPAIGSRPEAFALKVKFTNLLGAIPVRRLGQRTWCLASLGLILA
jgi:hypothetical protein